jgi:adenylate cyclase
MYELVFLSGVRAGAVVSVTGPMMSGRSPDCDIEVPDLNASRFHARFDLDGQHLALTDNGSSNGTFVNDERIAALRLKHGDIVRIGETRIRIQRRTRRSSHGSSSGSSSVFEFRGVAGDISGSLALDLNDPSAGANSLEELQSRLDAMIRVSESLASITELDELWDPILETLFGIFTQAERGFILLGDQMERLEPKATRSRSQGSAAQLEVSESLCRTALERHQIIVYADDKTTDFDQGMSLVDLNIRSAMVVPLMVKDEIYGLVVVDTPDRQRPFNEQDMGLAAAMCRQISIAIKNATLLKQVEREVRTRANLARFLPKQVVDQAIAGDLGLDLGGTTCHGTVLFADIIGFTRRASTMHPQEVVTMMNGLFNVLVPAIESAQGAVDKFMGDCTMALWGVPFDSGRAPLQALSAALHMQTLVIGYNHQRQGHAPLFMGIGVAAGPMVAGNIGSLDRLEFTVLGDTVNMASRIQHLACRDQVLVTMATIAAFPGKVLGVRMPPATVKNKAGELDLLSVRAVVAEGGEMVLHIPVLIAGSRGVLVRRLADGSLVLLHDGPLHPEATAVLDLTECDPIDLGRIQTLATLPPQQGDFGLGRSLVSVERHDLGGLLADEPGPCSRTWTEMPRGSG